MLSVLMLAWDVHRTLPTIRRLMDLLGVASTSTVHKHLELLEAHGYLARSQVRPTVLVPTMLADNWWAERKRTTTLEKVGG